MQKSKKKAGSRMVTLFLFLVFAVGAGLMLYPLVSNWWNEKHSSKAIATYVETVKKVTPKEQKEMIQQARDYNEKLACGVHFKLTEEEKAEYESILDITGTGIMGYVNIPSINVNLPIYHGTSENVLQIAAGHIEGSSFPVGGSKTHSVISGHRGLPSAKLFTDLDQLVVGDTFTVTVLSEILTYQVDQIRIVLPEEIEDLAIEENEDFLTLVTCTPYGINSHRMLVRGRRISDNASENGILIAAEATRITPVVVFVGVSLFLILSVVIVSGMIHRKHRINNSEILEKLEKKEREKRNE